ncbi:hypothetical protein NMY22_g18025 [Coprinellus aureogranulatus]|nr:hypothetical protein NMY22_g18025 [Coprinellus aureogranulatus]
MKSLLILFTTMIKHRLSLSHPSNSGSYSPLACNGSTQQVLSTSSTATVAPFINFTAPVIPAAQALVDKAPEINWHWVSATGDLQPVFASAGPPLTPNANFTSAPQLDYLLIPGPDPFLELSPQADKWIKDQYDGLKGLLSVCTGGLYLAQTGLLDGRQAATNKVALKAISQTPEYEKFNKVNWVPDARFVVDGKIWTTAGVTSGLDLAAAFARAHFDNDVVTFTEEVFEYKPNPDRPDAFAYLMEGVEL